MINWFKHLESWQKLMYILIVYAVVGGVVIYAWLTPYTWAVDVYLGVILATCVAITVVGVVERRRRNEKLLGHRGRPRA